MPFRRMIWISSSGFLPLFPPLPTRGFIVSGSFASSSSPSQAEGGSFPAASVCPIVSGYLGITNNAIDAALNRRRGV
uniref:Putative secreted protein n=1 Tax=Anopheles marajoara TaxID=58244 RepID=A0A2M4CDJ7_9DIPT